MLTLCISEVSIHAVHINSTLEVYAFEVYAFPQRNGAMSKFPEYSPRSPGLQLWHPLRCTRRTEFSREMSVPKHFMCQTSGHGSFTTQ
jgi:hypothetical protein